MKEVKQYYKNGNLEYHCFKDKYNILYGVAKWYFYNEKLSQIKNFKKGLFHNVSEYWFDYDESNLFYAREFIETFFNNEQHGILIKFNY